MTEKDYIDLMHREVDGLLSETEKVKLQQYLNKNPRFNDLYQEIIQTADLANRIDDVDPPLNLKKNILNSIDSNRYHTNDAVGRERSLLLDWFTSKNSRVVLAFAAGLLVGIILYSVFIIDAGQNQQLNNLNFYGTIGIPENVNFKMLDQISHESSALNGHIRLFKYDAIIWFEINLTPTTQCDLIFSFDQSILRFSDLKPLDYTQTMIDNGQSNLKITLYEPSRFLLLFTQLTPENTLLDLKIAPKSEEPTIYNFPVRQN